MGSTLYVSTKCPAPGSAHNPTLGFSRRRMMVINLVMKVNEEEGLIQVFE